MRLLNTRETAHSYDICRDTHGALIEHLQNVNHKNLII
jgi:hypothetical protein